jgi:Metallo-beta-lactamase superfamily
MMAILNRKMFPTGDSAPVELKFHPVAQGLFYTGRIGWLNFVYDCGSFQRRRLSDAINDYRSKLKRRSIDVLILSHLDLDHVSGLNELLGEGGTGRLALGDVFMPYIPPLERLALAARNGRIADWYFELLSSPEAYFREKEARRVFFLKPGGHDGDEAPPWPNEQSPEETYLPREGSKAEPSGLAKPSEIQPPVDPEKTQSSGTKFYQASDDGSWNVGGKWIFRFFVNPLEESKLEDFQKCVSGLRQSNHDAEGDIALIVKKWIRQKSFRKRLRPCYDRLPGNLNRTTLSVFHGPVSQRPALHLVRSFNGEGPDVFRSEDWSGRGHHEGFLLTGDFEPTDSRLLDEFRAHYAAYFGHISGVMVPHHGAQRTWNPEFAKMLTGTRIWYVSAGIGNQYRHPGSKVVSDVTAAGGEILWASELWSIAELLGWS